MTPQEVMAYLHVGKNMLLRLRRQGLPFIKFPKKVLYRQSDVDAFMERLVKAQKVRK